MFKKMLIAGLVAMATIAGGANVVSASRVPWMSYKGVNDTQNHEIKWKTQPFIESARTFVPLREVATLLGAETDWEGSTQKITLTKENLVLTLHIGSNNLHVFVEGYVDKNIQMDVAPKIRNGTTFLPIRFIAENLGINVKVEGGDIYLTERPNWGPYLVIGEGTDVIRLLSESQMKARLQAELEYLNNTYRIPAGLKPLEWNDKLHEAAQLHSKDVLASLGSSGRLTMQNHAGSDGSSVEDRVYRVGYGGARASENGNSTSSTVFVSVGSTIRTWNDSPGHRANQMRGWDVAGLGLALSDEGRIIIYLKLAEHQHPGLEEYHAADLVWQEYNGEVTVVPSNNPKHPKIQP